MKNISKILTVVLALTMAFAFCLVGCDEKAPESNYNQVDTLNDKTTAQIYSDIMDTIDAYDNNFTTNVNYDIPCSVSVSGASLSMTLKMYDTFMMAGNNFYEKIYVDAGEIMGESLGTMTNEVWFVDNVAYIDVRGEIAPQTLKAKYSSTIEDIAIRANLDMDELLNPVYDFSQSDFEDVVFNISKTDATDVYFEIILDGTKAQEFAQKVSSKNLPTGATLEYGKINYKFIIDETGALDHIDISFKVKMTSPDATYDYTYNGEITFTDIGTTVVSAPANPDEFTDITDALPPLESGSIE